MLKLKKDFQDLDIIIEGSPTKLATFIKEEFGSSRVKITRQSPIYETIEEILRWKKYPMDVYNQKCFWLICLMGYQ